MSVGLITILLGVLTSSAAEPVRLTSDGLLKRDPIFVDDGKSIVYVVQENATRMRIMKMPLDTAVAQPMHADATNSEFEPAFSRDDRYYAFVQSRGNLSLALVIRDTENKTDAEIRPSGGFSGIRSPAIAPDNKRVLYCYPEGGRQQIYSVDMLARDKKKLTDSSGVNNWPHFSRDGSQIVFGSTRDENYEIYVMNADGSKVRRLTNSAGQDIRPVFSPDGKRIAFTSARDRNYEIYVMNADGTNLQRVTNHPERDDYPAWHPDGKRLLVVAERAGKHDLYLIDAIP